MPPPNPADLLPEMVLLWITVWRELAVLVKVKIPPPIPLPVPLTWVALLLSTWPLVMDMREFWLTQMPPPPAPTPAVVSTAELFWTMLLVNVASPLFAAMKLKIAIPAPLPLIVLQS